MTQAPRPGSKTSDHVDIALAKGDVANDRDFILDYRLAGDTIESGVLLHRGPDENFFLAMIEPPKTVAATAIVPREYLFVIDISGSMHGYPLDTAKALLAKLIGNLRPSDTFNVLLFSGDNSMLSPRSLPATQANIALAVRTIDRQSGGGSTELLPALRRAMAIPKDSDRSRTMIVITDGYVTVEREAFDLVSRNLGRANLFAFGIGLSVNRALIEGLARAGQGEPFIVTQSGDAAAQAERFRKMIDAPVLTQVKLRFERSAAASPAASSDEFGAYDIEPVAIGDLFASRPVVIFGKWKGRLTGKLIVEGLTANGNFRRTVDLAEEAKNGTSQPALRYLWARHRIASLSDQEALEGGNVQAKAITDLGLRYSLLTAYTSFIAVDRVVRSAPGQAVPVDQPSPMPQGVSDLAIGAEVPATPEAPAFAMLFVAFGVIALFMRRSRDGLGRFTKRVDAGSLIMHNVIRLSPSLPQRLHQRLERWIDGLWSLFDERVIQVARRTTAGLDRLPAWSWPLLVALSTWPSAAWAVRRLLDDSDDPLGIVALAALLLALWHARPRFDRAPRIAALALAAILVVASNFPSVALPDLVRALLASGAIVAALAAIADPDEPIAPYAGLAILSLPLLSSLQFYAGFPLRIVTAEATRWLLVVTGAQVARVGTALTVDGHLILVDAPCSGVQMAWVAYFTACTTAWMFRVSNRAFFSRLPLVGATVLVGNVVRNTVLVAAEADRVEMTDAMHAAVGLLAFVGVASIIAMSYARARRLKSRPLERRAGVGMQPSSSASAWLMATLAIAAMLPLAVPAASPPIVHPVEWPIVYEGHPMQPLALSPVELRFAAQFPGSIARFATDRGTVVMRSVDRPTRRLHPAVDCYRGIGFAIQGERLERDAEARLWRCFTATRDGRGLRVCERIVDADGRAFTDVSSWFWSASLARSHGPWRAVTLATPIGAIS